MDNSRRRLAFTLVELLVVVIIVGVLVSMLLPAVQSVREGARRTTCSNNLRQQTLAMHVFENTYGRFPPGINKGIGDGRNLRGPAVTPRQTQSDRARPIGWGMYILPFLELEAYYDEFEETTHGFDGNWWLQTAPDGEYLASKTIRVFHCPSDNSKDGIFNKHWTHQTVVERGAYYTKSNYVAACGACSIVRSADVDSRRFWGIMSRNSRTKFQEIADGSSNVIILAERGSRTELEAGSTIANPRISYGALWAGSVPLRFTSTPNHLERAADQVVIGRSTTGSNAAAWGINGFRGNSGLANSEHPGGALFAMADGSTHFGDENLALETFKELLAMADGEVVTGFDQ